MPSADPNQLCPKCSGAMEFGLLVDCTHGGGVLERASGFERALEWVRGIPGKSFWRAGAFAAKPGDRLGITTLRCTGCGFVELYTSEQE
jgi:hypothetical protein